ncbi:hypothetical protein D3C81_1972320 [compost metagenome]
MLRELRHAQVQCLLQPCVRKLHLLGMSEMERLLHCLLDVFSDPLVAFAVLDHGIPASRDVVPQSISTDLTVEFAQQLRRYIITPIQPKEPRFTNGLTIDE